MYWRQRWQDKNERRPVRAYAQVLKLCLVLMVVVGASAAFLVLLLGPVATMATPEAGLRGIDKANALNDTRQTLLAAVGGIVVLAGAAYTSRTYYLGRRGQLTDRYAKAIGLLASDQITERLGGVYALEHLMIESDREHETVIEVLAAFIRERANWPGFQGRVSADHEHHHKDGSEKPRPETDVQAALTVIGRRPKRAECNAVDLSFADLCGATLDGNLEGVYFWGAQLKSAVLIGGHLKRAVFCWAQMQDADISWGQLQHANFSYAQMRGVTLLNARLRGADFTKADLKDSTLCGANLAGANLSGTQLQGADFVTALDGQVVKNAHGLKASQLKEAIVDEATRLPEGL
jgi:hypothetical protein